MKIHLIDGPGHDKIVEHSEINRPYYFKKSLSSNENLPGTWKLSIKGKELERFRYYIYIFHHRTKDGIIHFKCENPNE